MIPRTSIDEANRHLQQLHRRLHELEATVNDQHEALAGKDQLLQNRVAEILSTKEKEIEGLSNTLLASERTVSVLQEELERKNQQIVALQHSHSRLKRVLTFKDDVKDLFKTMEDAEDELALDEGDTDGLLSFYQRPRLKVIGPVAHGGSLQVSGKKSRKKKIIRPDNPALENGAQSEMEAAPNIGGKEFYL